MLRNWVWSLADRRGVLKVAAAAAILATGLSKLSWPSAQERGDHAPLVELDQGWSAETSIAWYTATQGSRLIPLVWLRALEQSYDSSKAPQQMPAFMDAKKIASYGYLSRIDANNQPLWPIGFAIDKGPDDGLKRTALRWNVLQGEDEPWIGLNCSACHTSEFSYNGKSIRVDGGSALADFKRFITDLNKALEQTKADPQRWDRFAKSVLAEFTNSPRDLQRYAASEKLLKESFDKLLVWQHREAKMNDSNVDYGPSRVDAFGHIYNKVALLLNEDADIEGNPADAPVSIPHIWRAPQYDKVQYNGIAPKAEVAGIDFGALGRNAGEVIGVFGDVVPNSKPGLANGFYSSIKVGNLSRFEDTLAKLRPPRWPGDIFDNPDAQLVAKGSELYKAHCGSCHELVSRTDLTTPLTTELSRFNGMGTHSRNKNAKGDPEKLLPPFTDPWMACNSFDYQAPSGMFLGYENASLGEPRVQQSQPLGSLLKITVAGTLFGKKLSLSADVVKKAIGFNRNPLPEVESAAEPSELILAHFPKSSVRSAAKEQRIQRCALAISPLLGYTSRPLNGIWASPPYLHNGSVPTINDLLQPPNDRPKTFFLGTRHYDPNNMGYVVSTEKDDAIGNVWKFKTTDEFGSPIDGNSNLGHDYNNAQFNADDRAAIIAFLKTL